MISAAGGDDLDIQGGPDGDMCDGGAGRDRCDGGSPGGPGNSPEDTDICEAEVKLSCRDGGFPDRWQVKMTGHEVSEGDSSGDTYDWSITMTVVRHGDPATTAMWRYELATGRYTGSGHYGDCSFTESGTLDRNWSADFLLASHMNQYAIDVVGNVDGTRAITCPDRSSTVATTFEAWGATGWGPEGWPWDRTQSEIVGDWLDEDPGFRRHIQWVISPLA